MSIFNNGLKGSYAFFPLMITLSVLKGIINVCLLFFITSVISPKEGFASGANGWIYFVITIAVSYFIVAFLQSRLINMTVAINTQLEVELISKISAASYEEFESIDKQNIYAAVGDVKFIGGVLNVVVGATSSFIIVLCGFVYLFIISVSAAAVVVGLFGLVLTIYVIRSKVIEKDFRRMGDLQNDFYRYLNDLLLGFKEVKMSRTTCKNLSTDFLIENRLASKEVKIKAEKKYLFNELTASHTWYLVLGVVLFAPKIIFPGAAPDTSTFVITLLYLAGPLGTMINSFPYFASIKVSLDRLDEIMAKIKRDIKEPAETGFQDYKQEPFKLLELRGVSYSYRGASGENFKVGPIDFMVQRGEVILITGGNGSGKSTFVNILAGLFQPASGEIVYNGKKLEASSFAYYSNDISCVFSKNHMFSENYAGLDLRKQNDRLTEYLEIFDLANKVDFEHSRNAISHDLSMGQSKRLALIYALIENKDILILDEWAAEQDFKSREFFYKILLPKLKQQGKTVLVVSHDDEYFHCAERTLKFSMGNIVHDTAVSTNRIIHP